MGKKKQGKPASSAASGGSAGRSGGLVQTPALGYLGLLGLLYLCVLVLRSQLDLEHAAVRAVVLLVALAVVDKLVLPAARGLIGPGTRHL